VTNLENGISIEEILKLDSMNGAKVLAGYGRLGSMASNVVVMEVPDIEDWVFPGDFLLTTGFAFSDNPSAFSALIPKLKSRSIAGLAVKPERYLKHVPKDLVRRAKDDDFVLIELSKGASFSRISHECFSTIFEHNAQTFFAGGQAQRNGFLFDLLSKTDLTDAEIRTRASYLGIDLNRQHTVHIINPLPEGDREPSGALSPKLAERILAGLGASMPLDRPGMMAVIQNRAVLLIDDACQISPSRLYQRVREVMPAADFSIGTGLSCSGIAGIRKSYGEGSYALKVGERLFGDSRMYSYENLGIYRLLFETKNANNLRAFYADVLEKLELYDREHRSNYMDTLELFFRCNGSYTCMAKTQFLHYNSIVYRMERIQKILQIDLEDEEARLNVQLGLKIRKIFDQSEEGGLAGFEVWAERPS
jgi:purine catabolism regulator